MERSPGPVGPRVSIIVFFILSALSSPSSGTGEVDDNSSKSE